MPKGSVRNPGTSKTAAKRSDQTYANKVKLRASPTGKQRIAKAVNEWNEYRAAGQVAAGHATASLRKTMKDVRSDDSVSRVKKIKAPVGKGGR